MDLLARREHSRSELAAKLNTRFGADYGAASGSAGTLASIISAVLDQLIADGLLSDERFAEALVRARVNRGQGPRRIVEALRTHGVCAELANTVLQNREVDWSELARTVAAKKFGLDPADNVRQVARRRRFLQYRGFTAEQINYALNAPGHL